MHREANKEMGQSVLYPELQQKKVISSIQEGLGWDVKLECGHQTWFATEPGSRSFCGQCLDAFIQKSKAARRSDEQAS